MDITRKFEHATSNNAISIGKLEINRNYPIIDAQWVITKYGHTVFLSIKDEPYDVINFLPQRYGAVFTDEDLSSVTTQKVFLHLVYKGLYDKSKSYILGIEE